MNATQIKRLVYKFKKTSLFQILFLFLLIPQTYSQEATAEIEEEQTVQEQIQEVQIKSISYVELTFHSDINNFDAAKKFIKGTEIFEDDLPKLKNRKYDFYAWKANDQIITFPFTPQEDLHLTALWNEKAIIPSDWIQILVVVVAFLAIIIPRYFQKKDEKKEKKEAESKQPKLRLHCSEKDEGIFTKCTLTNDDTPAISFKIRVFNDGLTTAKNVQLRIKEFDVTHNKKIAEFKYSFFKLFWAYQDQKSSLNMPLDTKIDIQPNCYEDCDFVIINSQTNHASFVSEQSDLLLNSSGNYRVKVVVSADNILSFEKTVFFYFDTKDYENPIQVNVDFA